MPEASEVIYETPLKMADPTIRSPKVSEPHSPKATPTKLDLWGVMRSPLPQSPAPATQQSPYQSLSALQSPIADHGWLLDPQTPRDSGTRSIFGVQTPTPQPPPRAPPASPMEFPDSFVTPGRDTDNEFSLTLENDSAEPIGLVLDLHGKDYTGNSTWVNRVPNQEDAHVPSSVTFDEEEKAFVFSSGGDVITVPLATNGNFMRDVSYCAWVKVPDEFPKGNLGWIITQCPDYAWSRALTLNDYRLGHVSITSSGYWESNLGRAPLRRWCHVVGVWRQGGESTVYLNGNRGGTIMANNGRGSDPSEVLAIGGRGPGDRVHNPPVAISRVSVYDRALSDAEVAQLFHSGRDAFNSPSLDALSPRILRQMIAAQEPPKWDEATRLFWCSTGVNVHDLPDGDDWQREFKAKLSSCASTQPVGVAPEKRRVLRVQVSDAQVQQPQQRVLARHPSDPEKRANRAAYSSALKQMSRRAGVSLLVHGSKVALFRFQDRVFAVAAECPHQGGALVEGEVGDIEDMVEGRKCYITCPVHKFQFDLQTGSVLDGRCGKLTTFPTRIVQTVQENYTAMIDVGFESLADDYFHEFEADDF